MTDPQHEHGTTHGRRLRVAVVGIGWAGRQHLEAYANSEDVEILGLAGMEPALLAELQAEYGIPHAVARWEDLLALDGLDAVSVAVPTFLHAPIAVAALEQGLHVLSEKPIARNGDEGQAMVDAARRTARGARARRRVQPPAPRGRRGPRARHRRRPTRAPLLREGCLAEAIRHPVPRQLVHQP